MITKMNEKRKMQSKIDECIFLFRKKKIILYHCLYQVNIFYNKEKKSFNTDLQVYRKIASTNKKRINAIKKMIFT